MYPTESVLCWLHSVTCVYFNDTAGADPESDQTQLLGGGRYDMLQPGAGVLGPAGVA